MHSSIWCNSSFIIDGAYIRIITIITSHIATTAPNPSYIFIELSILCLCTFVSVYPSSHAFLKYASAPKNTENVVIISASEHMMSCLKWLTVMTSSVVFDMFFNYLSKKMIIFIIFDTFGVLGFWGFG